MGRVSSKHPPWSTEISTSTDPSRMRETKSLDTSLGALAPTTSTAPMTMSASRHASSRVSVDDAIVCTRPSKWMSTWRRRSRFRSRILTLACSPTAMDAAASPATPAPITTTLAGCTPGTPPINVPRPPPGRIRWYAPIKGAIRPATSLIGVNNGNELSRRRTVSYAIATFFAFTRASVHSRDAARCRYVKSTWFLWAESRWYSSAIGSLTFNTRSLSAQTSSASSTMVAPLAT